MVQRKLPGEHLASTAPSGVPSVVLLLDLRGPVVVFDGELDFVVDIGLWQGDTLTDLGYKLIGASVLSQEAQLLSILLNLGVHRLHALLRLVVSFGLDMKQDHAFPFRCDIRILIHGISLCSFVLRRASIQTAPGVETSRLASLGEELLDAQDQGADMAVERQVVVIVRVYDQPVSDYRGLHRQQELLLDVDAGVDVRVDVRLERVPTTVGNLHVAFERRR